MCYPLRRVRRWSHLRSIVEVPTIPYLVVAHQAKASLRTFVAERYSSFKNFNEVTFIGLIKAYTVFTKFLLIVPLYVFCILRMKLCLTIQFFDPIGFRSNIFFDAVGTFPVGTKSLYSWPSFRGYEYSLEY